MFHEDGSMSWGYSAGSSVSGKCLLTLVACAAQGSELCSGKDEMEPICLTPIDVVWCFLPFSS